MRILNFICYTSFNTVPDMFRIKNRILRNFSGSIGTLLLMMLFILSVSCVKKNQEEKIPFPADFNKKLEWWKDARFGMFIHWGPVSLNGTEIGWSRGRELSVEEYDSLYLRFNPVKFNADEWVSVARAAGMKYIVLTTKHHDGFCLWDTEYTDYNIMHSPFKRDVVKELSEACKKQGIAFGTYYSVCDWHHPDFPLTGQGGSLKRDTSDIERYTQYLINQSAELIHKYGPLLVMWYDVPQQFDSVRGQYVIDKIKALQPGIMVNDRSGARGDFSTPEQRLGNFNIQRPWETCMTIGRQWAWKPNDEIKSFEQCMHNLIRTVGGDGNLLFNVGPGPDGAIEPEQVERLKEMGAWLDEYGIAVYGTRGGPYKPTDWGVSTRKGNKIFLHLLNWPEKSKELSIPDIGLEIKSCRILGGNPLNYTRIDSMLLINLGNEVLKPVNAIIQLDFDGNVMDVPSIEVMPKSVVYRKTVVASSNNNPHWSERALHLFIDANSVVNGDWSGDFWHPAGGDTVPWLEIDLGPEKTVRKASLFEWGDNIKAFEIQYQQNGEWKGLYKGDTIGPKLDISFPQTKLDKVRLVIMDYNGIPGIYEFALYSN